MSVTIKGKKCRNIAEQVAFNDYRISKLVGEGIEECVHKLGNESGSGQPYHFPYHFTATFDNATRKLKVKLYTITLDNKKTLTQYEQEVHIPGGGAGGDAVWGEITGTINNQADLMALINGKQDTLVSGTNIKTINSQSLLGAGNITISGEPESYLKNASVSDNTLTITKKDDTEVTYTPNLDGYMTLSGNQVIYTKVLNSTSGDRSINLDLTGGQPGIEVKESGSDHVDYRIVYGPKSIKVANIPEGSASVYSNFSFPTTLGNYTFATTSDLSSKLDATKCTIQTTAPTTAITDGGIHIVVLSTDPATKYDGYIYLIG